MTLLSFLAGMTVVFPVLCFQFETKRWRKSFPNQYSRPILREEKALSLELEFLAPKLIMVQVVKHRLRFNPCPVEPRFILFSSTEPKAQGELISIVIGLHLSCFLYRE